MLVQASKQLNKGLKFTGGVIAKGFEGVGKFIAKKVPKSEEETEVTKSTKDNLKLVKNTTGNVL